MILAVIRILQAVVLTLPRRVANACGASLGLFWFHVLRYRRALVEENLARSFGTERRDPEIKRLARQNFRHYGLLLVETLRLPKIIGGDLAGEVRFEGLEHLEEARGQGRGVIILTAHLGNYDLPAVALSCSGFPVSFISKEVKIKQIEKFWMSQRSAAGLHIFTKRDSIRELFKALRRNELLGIILDQHARTGGVQVDFFGRKASTLRMLAVLAQRSQAPVVPIFDRRLDDSTHVVEILPPVPFEDLGSRDESLLHNTQRYTAIIEEAVRRNPTQWIWIHRRWKDSAD